MNSNCEQNLGGLPPPTDETHIDLVEVGAGKHRLSSMVETFGLTVLAIDRKYSRLHDYSKSVGLFVLLQAIRTMPIGALLWLAPSCSSWIFLSRGTTGRSRCCHQLRSYHTYYLFTEAELSVTHQDSYPLILIFIWFEANHEIQKHLLSHFRLC